MDDSSRRGDPIRYCIVGLEPSDGMLLKVMIERAAQRLDLLVDYGSTDNSAWVFFRGARPTGLLPHASMIEIRKHVESDAHGLRFPPRISELLDLLVSLRAPASEGWEHGSSYQLAVAVSRWLESKAPAQLIRWRDGSRSLLRTADRRFQGQYPQGGLARFRAADGKEMQEWSGRPSQTLEPWLWQLGLLSASGGLMPAVSQRHRLRILVWPYLVAKSPPVFRRIATCLREQPRLIDELRALQGVNEEDLTAFLNATNLAGFLVSESVEEEPVNSQRSHTGGMRRGVMNMVRAVRQRLGISR